MLKKIIISSLALTFLFTIPAFAAECDFTVGDGETYTTIQSAVDAAKSVGTAGKTVCIKENKTYDEVITIQGVSGSNGNQFKIVGHPDNVKKPQIKRTAPNTDPSGNTGVFHIVDSSYVYLQNLHITSSSIIGINTWRSDNIHITDVVVEQTRSSAIRLLDTTNSLVENAYVKNAVNYASPQNYDGGFWGNAVGSTNSTELIKANPNFVNNNTFRNIEITQSWGELMSSLRSVGDTFENNYIHHNNQVGDQSVNRRIIITSLYADHAKGVTFKNNFLLFNHYNISFNDENEYQLDPRGRDRVVENNLIVGPTNGYYGNYSWPWGIMFVGCESATPCNLVNDSIKNNTIVNTPDGGVIFYPGYNNVSNVNFNNNIIVPRSGATSLTFYNIPAYNGVTFNGNVYTENPINSVGLTGGQVVDRDSVFTNSRALDTNTYTQDLDPNVFTINSAYSGKGANVSKVGLLRRTTTDMYKVDPNTTPTPTIQEPTPSPSIDLSFDHTGDGLVDIRDLLELVKYIFR